ncbi:MAG TPA: hypothetical protein PKC30_12480 [Saprospiraceae bacterium]|nr:hypothetical protein [Saprospiraceae bacterium]
MTTSLKIAISIIIFLLPEFCSSQYPSTSLYLFDVDFENDSLFLYNVQYLSGFNVNGYNNQPYFVTENELYISSNAFDTSGMEIVFLNLSRKNVYRVTDTYEKEFSPTLSPSGKHISCIRIEKNERDQSLWLYPIDRSFAGHRLFPGLENVGYHIWIADDELVLFLVGNPNQLVLANIKTEEVTQFQTHIGRCFKLNGNGELLFVHKLSPSAWYLKSYDFSTGTSTLITSTLPGKEDFEILPDGSILMGSDSSLYRYKKNYSGWQWVDDLTDSGISNITRLTLSAGRLAVVNTDE